MDFCHIFCAFAILTYFKVSADNVSNAGPTFVREPPNHVEFSNSSGAVIGCLVDGRPYPTITWTKQNGERLHDLPGLRYVRHDNALVFPAFNAEDYAADIHATTYRCVATNVVGTVGSREIHVRAVVIQDYEIRLLDQFVLQGNMVLVRCPIPNSLVDYIKVTAWERNDGLIITHASGNEKYGILDNGALYLQDTRNFSTAWKFRCHTANSITGQKKLSTNFARITVTEPHHNQPPRIMQRTSNVTVSAGSRVTLSCVAQGHPAPAYRWHKLINNQPIGLHVSTARQNGGILTFQKVLSSDSGRYLCHVRNDLGEDSVEMQLNIEEPISVTVSPRELQADIGGTITFSCNISGGQVDSIIWRKDMRTLTPSQHITFHSPSTIQLRQLKRADSGMYQCFVHRRYDCYQASARLLIRDIAPEFKSTFTERTIRPGSYVSLTCIAAGNPEPRMRWTLDGHFPLSTRPGLLVNSYLGRDGTVTSHLNFTSVDVSDGGLYECEASNAAGVVRHSRRLNVFGPVFVRPLGDLTAVAGSDFQIACPFGGFPFLSVKWKREDRNLPLNQKQRTYPNGTLKIMNIQPGSDSGEYSCEVTSGHGKKPVSRSFRIAIRVGPKVASFSFLENLHEGMRTAITCIVLAGDGPLATEWLKDGLPISEQELNVIYSQQAEGLTSTLTFKNLTYAHNGNYTCISRNDVASASFSTVLTVKVPPRWLLEPKDVSAVTGRPARIDCQAEGVPQPHVRWKMASSDFPEQFKTIVSGSHVHILANGSLNFREIEASDAGYYLCEANNGFGEGLSAIVRLDVHSAPLFINKFMATSVRRGEKAKIECNPEGDRPVVYSWKKNGVNIDFSSEPRYIQTMKSPSQKEYSVLVIEKAERKDSSVLTCSAANEYGEDSMNVQVVVQDIPDAPQSLEILDLSSRSVRLTWKQPFDGNFPITRYTVMWRHIDGVTSGGPVYVQGSETTVVIRGLKPNTRYFFRVKCENALGESQFGAEVAATTLEEPPSHPPDNVKASPTSSRTVKVVWQIAAEDVNSVDGFYVGFKPQRSPDPFIFKSVSRIEDVAQQYELTGLDRNADYSVVVQAYNARGAGPPSEQVAVRTLEFDRPEAPVIRSYFATSNALKLSWTINRQISAPVTGYILHFRTESGQWQEAQLTGDAETYSIMSLQCGTAYRFYLEAFNTVGTGNASETISVKTEGSPPVAPDKRLLLSINSTAVTVNLKSWHDGGCPISTFTLQYRLSGQQEWTLISDNIPIEQINFTVSDLKPGTWYSLLMTARNNAGATDAEYVFATLTPTGEIPPRPSMVNDSNATFYRHLTITIPAVSSIVVLLVVSCALCFVTRRRNPASDNSQRSDYRTPVKSENAQVVTYDPGQESIYFPEPYAMDVMSGYNRGRCGVPGTGQNADTFGSGRGKLSAPSTPRMNEKRDYSFEIFSAYQQEGSGFIHNQPIYEVPNVQKTQKEKDKSWKSKNRETKIGKEQGFSRSNSSPARNETKESETECDRLWKAYEDKRWSDRQIIAT